MVIILEAFTHCQKAHQNIISAAVSCFQSYDNQKSGPSYW